MSTQDGLVRTITAMSDGVTPHPATLVIPPPHSDDVEARELQENSGDESSPTREAGKRKPPFGVRPAVFRSTLQEVVFVFMATMAIATPSFLAGSTVIVTASIGEDLDMTQGQISWISAAATLTAGAFQLGLGQLADLVGRKPMFLIGLSTFGSFALVAGFAQNGYWMNVMCGVLGVSSAMVVPPAIGILGAAYAKPSRRKNFAFAAFSAGNPLGFVFGSIFCGIASRISNWRAAFVLLCILWAILSLVGFWAIPRDQSTSEPLRTRVGKAVKTFDSLGTVLTIVGTGLLTSGLTLGPTDGWKASHVVAFLVVGVSVLVVFVFWERVYPSPLMPPHIWKNLTFSFLNVVVHLGMMSFQSAQFWLSFFMQSYVKAEPLMVAVYLIPQAIAGLIWNVVAGAILHKVNNRLIVFVGSLAYVAANLLLMLSPSDTSTATKWYWPFVFPSLILGVVGADFQFNVANMYIMQSFPSEQQSLAGGIFNTLIRLTTTIALGLTTAAYESTRETEEAQADPMLPYRRAWMVSVILSGLGCLFVPLVNIKTQGNVQHDDTEEAAKGSRGNMEERRDEEPEKKQM